MKSQPLDHQVLPDILDHIRRLYHKQKLLILAEYEIFEMSHAWQLSRQAIFLGYAGLNFSRWALKKASASWMSSTGCS